MKWRTRACTADKAELNRVQQHYSAVQKLISTVPCCLISPPTAVLPLVYGRKQLSDYTKSLESVTSFYHLLQNQPLSLNDGSSAWALRASF